MAPLPSIILASTSAHRQVLLQRLRLPFTAAAAGIEEAVLPGERPAARALRLALAKARAVAARHPQAIVIGGDQVASLERASPGEFELLHKPGERGACHAQLRRMSGQEVRFDTAVAVIGATAELTHVDETLVRFRALTDGEIAFYMDREPSFDCAGGFKAEGLGVSLFESVRTRDPTALVGLPLVWLCGALRRLGARV